MTNHYVLNNVANKQYLNTGYYVPNSSGKVCHLWETLYGLKQSGRCWYQQLVKIIVWHLGFSCCDVDQAVYFQRKGGTIIIILVHVDDCTITATAIKLIERFKQEIAKHINITDLGELHWLLGIEHKHNREKCTIYLSQHLYIDPILSHYNLQDLEPVSIPMETSIHLLTSQSPATTTEFSQMHDVPYHEAVGSLIYASLRTCPDISFAVQTVSCFSMKPGLIHWDTVK
jgi:hypothetical protein